MLHPRRPDVQHGDRGVDGSRPIVRDVQYTVARLHPGGVVHAVEGKRVLDEGFV